MKILVLGSGLLGVCTAYELARRGYEVTVVDRQRESARETSFSNGGQISYGSAEPLANPHVLAKLPKWIFNSDAPLVFRPRADWAMIRWGLAFLRNCTSARARDNCVRMLRLGLYSRSCMEKLRGETGIAFDFSRDGILHLYGSDKDFDHAKKQHDFQAKFGCDQRVLSQEECRSLEPALTHTTRQFVGGIHAWQDECGDPYLFCNALAKIAAERHNVTFRYGIHIEEIIAETDRIAAIATDQGDMTADGYVMAMGPYSALHLKNIGIRLPIYPLKGYSVTLPANDYCPRVSLTDVTYKVVYTRLGNRLRIAGTAEFAGYNDKVNKRRIAPILRAARIMLPRADWNQPIETWACLRPSTPDGPPILGPTPYRNLFLNTGHGMLGWTQAAGSATIVADIMQGKPPHILMEGLVYGFNR